MRPRVVAREASGHVRLHRHPGGQLLASFCSIRLERVEVLLQAARSEQRSALQGAPTPGKMSRTGGYLIPNTG